MVIDINSKEMNNPKCLQVTSSNMSLKNGDPPEDGLASYTIFGRPGTVERERNEGYIDLQSKFIHPHVLRALRKIKRELFKDIINGYENFYIDDKSGEILRIPPGTDIKKLPNVGSGIHWLYKNWSLIRVFFKPKPSDASATKENKKFIYSLDRDEVFINNFLVMPAFYRDVDMHTNQKNIYNNYYVKILELSSMIKTTSIMMGDFQITDAHRKIQNLIDEFSLNVIKFVGGNKGFLHKHVIGKSVEFSARLVASVSIYNGNSVDDAPTSFDRVAPPLHALVQSFLPFVSYGLKQLVTNIVRGEKYFIRNKERIEYHPSAFSILDSNKLLERTNLFVDSKYSRLDPVEIRDVNDNYHPILAYHITHKEQGVTRIQYSMNDDMPLHEYDENYIVERKKLTWLELIYLACENTIKDKIIYITRYPVESNHSMFPTMFNIIPCQKTKKVFYNDKPYKLYPDLEDKSELTYTQISHYFIDTLRIFQPYAKALTLDYDGDMIQMNSVFTKEAEEEAKKYIYSTTNIINVQGGNLRPVSEPAQLAIYNLTRGALVV